MSSTMAETPAARNTDPVTSHLAADAITASGERGRQQQIVEATVFMFPGCTSAELARCCELDRFQIARRCPEVELAGRIQRGEPRKCAVGHRKAITWFPA